MNSRMRFSLSILLLVTGFAFSFIYIVHNVGVFSPDSYSYYDISKTFGHDFGLVNTIRQYVFCSDYNCSFPYLYPLLIFVTDTVTGLGIYSGVVVNIVVMIATAIVCLSISRLLVKDEFCGAIAVFLLFINPNYAEEVCMGRAIPLSVFLMYSVVLALVYIYINDFDSRLLMVLVGGVVGLNMMNRMDEISLVAFLFVFLLWFAPQGKKIKTLFFYSIGVIIPCIPWIVYSVFHFGVMLISDNSFTYRYITTEYPNYVFIPGKETETIFSMPLEWLKSRLCNEWDTMLGFFSDMLSGFSVVMFLLGTGFLGFAKSHGEKLSLEIIKRELPVKKALIGLLWVVAYAIAKLSMYAFVGYNNQRYYAETISLITFAVLLYVWKWIKSKLTKNAFLLIVFAIFVSISVSGIGDGLFTNDRASDSLEARQEEWIQNELQKCMKKNAAPGDRILMVGKSLNGFRFGATNDWRTYVSPENVSTDTVQYLLDNYVKADWLVLSKSEDRDVRILLSNNYPEEEYDSFYLYSLRE